MDRRIQAAGGVVWRRARAGLELALVHRPRYDDWSLPKGKADPGEHPVQTAVREVAEETGQVTVVGRPLGTSEYDVLVDGAPTGKLVRWFAMEAARDGRPTGEDVDDVRWLAPTDALRQLTQPRDVDVARRFLAGPPDPRLVLLVRHAKAGRAVAGPDDDLRELEPAGWAQARALAPVLAAFAPARVASAPVVRCRQTVQPLADLLSRPVQVRDELGEDHHARDPHAAEPFVRRAATRPSVVLCSQGGLIPDVLTSLRPDEPEPSVRKASAWVLAFDGDHLVTADLLPPVRDGNKPAR